MQPFARCFANGALHIGREALSRLEPAADIVERGLETVRRIIAVQARDHVSLLIEEQYGGRELDTHRTRKVLFGTYLPIQAGHLAIPPDIYRQRDEVPPRLFDDARLREIGLHQGLAVRTAVLAEVDHQSLAFLRGVAHVLAKIEECFGEPGRDIDGVRARRLRMRRGRHYQHHKEGK